jgi:hypothetical protein
VDSGTLHSWIELPLPKPPTLPIETLRRQVNIHLKKCDLAYRKESREQKFVASGISLLHREV